MQTSECMYKQIGQHCEDSEDNAVKHHDRGQKIGVAEKGIVRCGQARAQQVGPFSKGDAECAGKAGEEDVVITVVFGT